MRFSGVARGGVTSPDAVLLWRVHGQGNGENLSPPPPPHFVNRLVPVEEKGNFEAHPAGCGELRLYRTSEAGVIMGTEAPRRRD